MTPSIAIGVISTAFTDPGTAVGLLSTYGILGLVLMYLMANIALYRPVGPGSGGAGVHENAWAWVVTPGHRRPGAGHPDLG